MKKNKIYTIISLLLISLFIFSGCSNTNQNKVKVISDKNTNLSNTNSQDKIKVVPDVNKNSNNTNSQKNTSVESQIDNQIISDNNTVQIGELI